METPKDNQPRPPATIQHPPAPLKRYDVTLRATMSLHTLNLDQISCAVNVYFFARQRATANAAKFLMEEEAQALADKVDISYSMEVVALGDRPEHPQYIGRRRLRNGDPYDLDDEMTMIHVSEVVIQGMARLRRKLDMICWRPLSPLHSDDSSYYLFFPTLNRLCHYSFNWRREMHPAERAQLRPLPRRPMGYITIVSYGYASVDDSDFEDSDGFDAPDGAVTRSVQGHPVMSIAALDAPMPDAPADRDTIYARLPPAPQPSFLELPTSPLPHWSSVEAYLADPEDDVPTRNHFPGLHLSAAASPSRSALSIEDDDVPMLDTSEDPAVRDAEYSGHQRRPFLFSGR